MTVHPPLRRILVGVEPDGLAAQAVAMGHRLAEELGARLELVHAVHIPTAFSVMKSAEVGERIEAEALAHERERVLEMLGEYLPELDRGAHEELLSVHVGHPAQVLLDRARESGAQLIVMGPHARDYLFDFGSTTRAVLSGSSVPVWTQTEPPEKIRKILVPVDFSEHSRRAIEEARALAEALGATIEVLHCYDPPSFAYMNMGEAFAGPTYVVDHERNLARKDLESLMQAQEWGSVEARSTFLEGATVDRILEQDAADLIVMGTHGRTGLSRYLVGSIAYGVLKRSKKPVLVVPSVEETWLLEQGTTSSAELPAIPSWLP